MASKLDGSFLVDREIARGHGRQLARATEQHCPPNLLDRISEISPAWSAQRTTGRMARTILTGGYDVTQNRRTRRKRHHTTSDGPADRAQPDTTLWKLREMCRDHDRNSGLLHGVIQRSMENICGPEYLFRPFSDDKTFNTEATAALTEMSRSAEYRGWFNLQQVIALTTRALFPDGDVFLHHLSDGKLQGLEAHDPVTPSGGKGYKDRRVVGGIELDDKGIPTAVYIRDPNQVEASHYYGSGWVGDWKTVQRIPWGNVTHVANRHRFSQTRGVPVLAPCLDMFERLDGYLDSEMLAAQLDADKVYYIKRKGAADALPGTQTVTDANADSESETTFDKLLRSEPGMIFNLDLDEDIGETGGKRPGDTFEPYIYVVLRMVGASIGYPLELVLLDFSRTNYSSARAALLQAYRMFKCWQVFVRGNIIQPIYNRWMSRWIAGGDLGVVPNAYRLQFTPPRWAWIDPLKSVLALQKQIAAGAGTLTDWVSEEGKIMEELAAVRAAELELFGKLNIPTTTAPAQPDSSPVATTVAGESPEAALCSPLEASGKLPGAVAPKKRGRPKKKKDDDDA